MGTNTPFAKSAAVLALYITIFIGMSFSPYTWLWHTANTISTIGYIVICLLLLEWTRKYTTFRIAHWVSILIYLLLISGILFYPWLVLPWIFLYPLLRKKQAQVLVRGSATLTYILFVTLLGLYLFIHILFLGFSAVQTIASQSSPTGKYNVVVTSYDQGALGIDFAVTLETRYWYVFKHSKVLSWDKYDYEDITWSDDTHFRINDRSYNTQEIRK